MEALERCLFRSHFARIYFAVSLQQHTAIGAQSREEIPGDLVSATVKPGQRLISSVSNVDEKQRHFEAS